MSEIAPLNAVQDQIKDRIKAEFVNLIPDEMWAQMVRSVVHSFTSPVKRPYNQVDEAPIKTLIREAIEAECKAKIAAELSKHTSSWDGYGVRTISEATQEIIRDHLPTMLAAMQEGSVKMMVDAAIQNMRQHMGQY